MKKIVLASASPYRRELLSRLRIPFAVAAPGVDEGALPEETPRETALRLARTKAEVIATTDPQAIVIGSDQVAELDGAPLGKPGTRAAAVAQLTAMQGRRVVFYTAIAVVCGRDRKVLADCIDTAVTFRPLNAATIARYVDLEPAWDVAGAAKIESLGIALVVSVDSADPTALIGLPLIRLVSMLADFGVMVPPGP